MEKIENKKKIIIVSIAVTLILAIAISFGYLGIFNIDLNNVMNVNITIIGNVSKMASARVLFLMKLMCQPQASQVISLQILL